MPDLPDWWQGFQLVGSDITINVNIEASGVTLPISIDAVTADLDVTIVASDVTIDFNFADQSVAVFDAAKWFAHQAEQVFVYGDVNGAEGSWLTVVDYTVPANKVFYAIGVAFAGPIIDGAVYNTTLQMLIGASEVLVMGSSNGGGLPLDTPLRATTGQHVQLWVKYQALSSPGLVYGSVWGYLEDV